MKVEASNVRRASGPGDVVALLTISIGDSLTIHDCRISQPPDQLHPKPELPRAPWRNCEGEGGYPIIELKPHVKYAVFRAMLRAHEEHRHAVA